MRLFYSGSEVRALANKANENMEEVIKEANKNMAEANQVISDRNEEIKKLKRKVKYLERREKDLEDSCKRYLKTSNEQKDRIILLQREKAGYLR